MLEWIQSNFNGLIVGIITGFIVSIVCFMLNQLVCIVKIRNSKFSGEWEQLIFNNNYYEGNPIKRDVYKLKHKKIRYSGKLIINIEGTIIRIFPQDQKHRKWDFIGYLEGEVLTILYQAQEGQKSRGCIYVKLYNDFEFRGYYLEGHKDGTIDKTPLIIKKRRDKYGN